jgi:hypothetical protein
LPRENRPPWGVRESRQAAPRCEGPQSLHKQVGLKGQTSLRFLVKRALDKLSPVCRVRRIQIHRDSRSDLWLDRLHWMSSGPLQGLCFPDSSSQACTGNFLSPVMSLQCPLLSMPNVCSLLITEHCCAAGCIGATRQ